MESIIKNPWIDFVKSMDDTNLILKEEQNVIHDFNLKVKDEFKIHTNIMPAPFMGDVKNAPIMILVLNPGYDELEDKKGFYSKYKPYWKNEIQHQFNPDLPLFCLDDEYRMYSDYWAKKLNPIIQALGENGKEIVAKNVSKVQLFPYQSKKYKPIHKLILKKYGYEKYLPSQCYNIRLVEEAINRNALIIIPRAVNKWIEAIPELKHYENVMETNSYLNITLSEKNLGDNFNKLVQTLKRL